MLSNMLTVKDTIDMTKFFVDYTKKPTFDDWVVVDSYSDFKKHLWKLKRSSDKLFTVSFGNVSDIDNYLDLFQRLLIDYYHRGDNVYPQNVFVHTDEISTIEYIVSRINNFCIHNDIVPVASWKSLQ